MSDSSVPRVTGMSVKGTDGQISFDGEWLTITRKGFIGTITKGGRGEMRLHIGQITGIDLKKPGATAGRFTVIAAGAVNRRAGWVAHRDDTLTVLFQWRHREEFGRMRDEVLRAIAARNQPQVPQQPGGVDMVGQLRQLADLHAAGALSEAEYAAAKQRLIG